MSEMSFLPSLASFLKSNGFIYTVRKYMYTSPGGFTEVEGVGRCKRILVMQLHSLTELDAYVVGSGFASLFLWQQAVKRFIKPGEPMLLYKVSVKV